MTSYNVEVSVTGGRTGSRTSLLKVDGQVVEFEDYTQADDAAEDYQRRMNTPVATAHFSARVVAA